MEDKYKEGAYLYFIETSYKKEDRTMFRINLEGKQESFMESEKQRWLNIIEENGLISMDRVKTQIVYKNKIKNERL
jgi:hypothetical protein